LKTCDADIRVATKFGRAGNAYTDKYTKDILRQTVEGSLKRLGVDSLDLLQLHCIPPQYLKDGDVFDWLRELKREGLIKHFGASVETVEEGLVDRKSTRLNSSHVKISYAVFCLKKKKKKDWKQGTAARKRPKRTKT